MHHYRRYAALVVAAGAAASFAAGCGSSDDGGSTGSGGSTQTGTAQKAERTAPKVAVLQAALFDYQQAETEGIKKVVKAEGGSYNVFNANFDPQKTTSQCQDAITSGRYNALILSSLEPSGGIPCVTLAHKAGMPVAYIDGVTGRDPNKLEPQVPGIVGGIASLPSENAKDMVELVGRACKGIDPCKVIVEIASATDPLTNGVVTALEDHGYDVVAKIETNFDPGQIVQKLPDIVSQHRDANVFVGVQDATAIIARRVFDEAGMRDVKLIGNGGSRGGAAAVKDGTLFATVGAWPVQQGAIVTKMLVAALNGETPPPSSDSGAVDEPRYVTKETVDQFKPEWGLKG